MHMRTTILLPDDLYQQVRLTATEERRTITSVIEQALRDALRERQSRVEAPAYRVDVISGHALQAGIDLDDNAYLEELMTGHDRA